MLGQERNDGDCDMVHCSYTILQLKVLAAFGKNAKHHYLHGELQCQALARPAGKSFEAVLVMRCWSLAFGGFGGSASIWNKTANAVIFHFLELFLNLSRLGGATWGLIATVQVCMQCTRRLGIQVITCPCSRQDHISWVTSQALAVTQLIISTLIESPRLRLRGSQHRSTQHASCWSHGLQLVNS